LTTGYWPVFRYWRYVTNLHWLPVPTTSQQQTSQTPSFGEYIMAKRNTMVCWKSSKIYNINVLCRWLWGHVRAFPCSWSQVHDHYGNKPSWIWKSSEAGKGTWCVIWCQKSIEMNVLSGLYATVGCHPTRSTEFDKFRGGPDAYLLALDSLIANNLTGPGRVVAIGECGLGLWI
jgi:hypothetical protein